MASTFNESVFDFDLNFLHPTTPNDGQNKYEKQRKAILIVKKKTIATDALIKKYYAKRDVLDQTEKSLLTSKEECKQICIDYRKSMENCSKLENELQMIKNVNQELEGKCFQAENQYAAATSLTNQLQMLVKEQETQIESLTIESRLTKSNLKEQEKKYSVLRKENEVLLKHMCMARDIILKKKKLNKKNKSVLKSYEKHDYNSECESDSDSVVSYDALPSPMDVVEDTETTVDTVKTSEKLNNQRDGLAKNDCTESNDVVSVDTGRGSSLAFSDSDKCFHSPDYYINDSPQSDGFNSDKSKKLHSTATSPIMFTKLVEMSTSPIIFEEQKNDINETIDNRSNWSIFDSPPKVRSKSTEVNTTVSPKQIDTIDVATSPIKNLSGDTHFKNQHKDKALSPIIFIEYSNTSTSPNRMVTANATTSPIKHFATKTNLELIQADKALSPIKLSNHKNVSTSTRKIHTTDATTSPIKRLSTQSNKESSTTNRSTSVFVENQENTTNYPCSSPSVSIESDLSQMPVEKSLSNVISSHNVTLNPKQLIPKDKLFDTDENVEIQTNKEKECLNIHNSDNNHDDTISDSEIEMILSTMRMNCKLITPIPSSPKKSKPSKSHSSKIPTSHGSAETNVCHEAALVREENKKMQASIAQLMKEVMSIKVMLRKQTLPTIIEAPSEIDELYESNIADNGITIDMSLTETPKKNNTRDRSQKLHSAKSENRKHKKDVQNKLQEKTPENVILHRSPRSQRHNSRNKNCNKSDELQIQSVNEQTPVCKIQNTNNGNKVNSSTKETVVDYNLNPYSTDPTAIDNVILNTTDPLSDDNNLSLNTTKPATVDDNLCLNITESSDDDNLNITEPSLDDANLKITEPSLEDNNLNITEPSLDDNSLKITEPSLDDNNLNITESSLDHNNLKIMEPSLDYNNLNITEPSLDDNNLNITEPSLDDNNLSSNISEPLPDDSLSLNVTEPAPIDNNFSSMDTSQPVPDENNLSNEDILRSKTTSAPDNNNSSLNIILAPMDSILNSKRSDSASDKISSLNSIETVLTHNKSTLKTTTTSEGISSNAPDLNSLTEKSPAKKECKSAKGRKLTKLGKLKQKMLPKCKIKADEPLPKRLQLKACKVLIPRMKRIVTDFDSSVTLNNKDVYERAVKVMSELKAKQSHTTDAKEKSESGKNRNIETHISLDPSKTLESNLTPEKNTDEKVSHKNQEHNLNNIKEPTTPQAIMTRSRSKSFSFKEDETPRKSARLEKNKLQDDKNDDDDNQVLSELCRKRTRQNSGEKSNMEPVPCKRILRSAATNINSPRKQSNVSDTVEQVLSLEGATQKGFNYNMSPTRSKVDTKSSSETPLSPKSAKMPILETVLSPKQKKSTKTLTLETVSSPTQKKSSKTPSIETESEVNECAPGALPNPKDSILCTMIQKYGVKSVRYCAKKITESVIDSIVKKIEEGIVKISTLPVSDTKKAMDKFVLELKKFDKKHFMAALIKYLKNPERKTELFKTINSPPAPPMTKSEQVLLYVISQLNTNVRTDIVEDLLKNIEFTLFALNRTPEFVVIESMSHFYAVLCRYFRLKSRLRIFIMDAMYCMQFKAVPLIKQCLDVWMLILPLAHMGIAKSPLVTCLVYLLHFYKCEDKFNRVQDIRNILYRKYFYQVTEWNETKILEMLKSAIMDIRPLSVERKMLRMALIIFGKRHGTRWCQKNIINKTLLPLIEKEDVPSRVKEFCLSMLGPLMKPYPADMKVHCEVVMNQLIDMFQQNPPDRVKEAIVSSLLYMDKHNHFRILKLLIDWRPKTISQDLELAMRDFVKSKPIKTWVITLSKLRFNDK